VASPLALFAGFYRGDAIRARLETTDFGIARYYALSLTFPARSSGAAQPTSRDLNWDWYVKPPGFVMSTNGTHTAESQLLWQIDLDASQNQVLTAESIYVDLPRIGVLVVLSMGLLAIRAARARSLLTSSSPARPGPGSELRPPRADGLVSLPHWTPSLPKAESGAMQTSLRGNRALRLFAYPDRSAPLTGTVAPGTKLEVLERSGEFVRVRLADGVEGWVPAVAVEITARA
jgi:hypothetical protein